jgi:hypothetical protein
LQSQPWRPPREENCWRATTTSLTELVLAALHDLRAILQIVLRQQRLPLSFF